MREHQQVAVFGEALFDQFADGKQVMGGAPLNVAWHLQAFGDEPLFISRVGMDAEGQRIKDSMQAWGLSTSALQIDPTHETGAVVVDIHDGEPHYDIRDDRAYDHIDRALLPQLAEHALLYCGTLAARHATSQAALLSLLEKPGVDAFVDVNLRAPWWNRQQVFELLHAARWAKLNQHELAALGFQSGDLHEDMAGLQQRFGLEQLILTRGKDGALVRSADGNLVRQAAPEPGHIIDSVGAGDAFCAMYIHGLRAGRDTATTLSQAQHFASAVLGQRGATTTDLLFYQRFR